MEAVFGGAGSVIAIVIISSGLDSGADALVITSFFQLHPNLKVLVVKIPSS